MRGFTTFTQDRSIPMTEQAISPLRRRMIEDMTIRKLAPKTQQGYIRTIKDFAAFLGRSPDVATFEDVRRFQLHRAESGADTSTLNHSVLSRLFRRLFLKALSVAHKAGRLNFFGEHAHLADARAFATYLAPTRTAEWVVYSKRPFGGPEAVLAYLSRYTHRVAIANSRLIASDDNGVTFRWKDYRVDGPDRSKVMTLEAGEFIRRFLIHVLPIGFHRIRSYGLFANGSRAENIARARELLGVPAPQSEIDAAEPGDLPTLSYPCPCCGGRMIIIETFEPGCAPRTHPISSIRIDTS